ncbi:MAG: hypothetical protein H6924_03020 [Alphaproteobacteria bacterium]|nr:hypothetical protein [Alphaproteobacteria bacterium]
MITRKRVVYIRLGPKRSRVRVGLRPFLFFIGAAVVLGAIAITLNVQIADRWGAYRAALGSLPVPDGPAPDGP